MASTNQDVYDKSFIKVLGALQKLGFCKNVAQLEKHLNIPKRTLYQVIKGKRGVPMLYRHALQRFLHQNYNVNPRIFSNSLTPVFVDEPPTVEEQPETYFSNNPEDTRWTMGDYMELDRLRAENTVLKERNNELQKEVTYWRELAMKTFNPPRAAAKKTATKPANGKKSKR